MPLVQHRLPHFFTGLAIGLVASALILTIWWRGKKDVESVAIPARELLVPDRGDWRLSLEAGPGWRIDANASFLRELVDGSASEPRSLTESDLNGGIVFQFLSSQTAYTLPTRTVHLGVLACRDDAPKICRAESHELTARSAPDGQAQHSVIVGK